MLKLWRVLVLYTEASAAQSITLLLKGKQMVTLLNFWTKLGRFKVFILNACGLCTVSAALSCSSCVIASKSFSSDSISGVGNSESLRSCKVASFSGTSPAPDSPIRAAHQNVGPMTVRRWCLGFLILQYFPHLTGSCPYHSPCQRQNGAFCLGQTWEGSS